MCYCKVIIVYFYILEFLFYREETQLLELLIMIVSYHASGLVIKHLNLTFIVSNRALHSITVSLCYVYHNLVQEVILYYYLD
jgi:hypothetical protein